MLTAVIIFPSSLVLQDLTSYNYMKGWQSNRTMTISVCVHWNCLLASYDGKIIKNSSTTAVGILLARQVELEVVNCVQPLSTSGRRSMQQQLNLTMALPAWAYIHACMCTFALGHDLYVGIIESFSTITVRKLTPHEFMIWEMLCYYCNE